MNCNPKLRMEKEATIEIISELIIKMIKGTIDMDEKVVLDKWIAQSSENRALYEHLLDERYALKQYQLYQQIEPEKVWGKISKREKKQYHWIRFVGYAASFLLLIGGAFLYWPGQDQKNEERVSVMTVQNNILPGTGKATLILSDKREIQLGQEHQVQMMDSTGMRFKNDSSTLYYSTETSLTDTNAGNDIHTLVVGRGGEFCVQLPDETVVYLNSDSKLRYPLVFNSEERKVYLEGEAYFEVKSDKSRTFVVESKGFSIKVLGTCFNVSNYKEDDVSRIVLLSGSVEVAKADKNYRLTPNQALEITENKIEIKKVNAVNSISWKNDKFYFSNERLEVVMRTLARWYDVNLFYTNQSIKDYHFSGFIPKYEKISKAFEILELTAKDVKFDVKDKTVKVMKCE